MNHDIVDAINRNRTIKRYCELTGHGMKYAEVSVRIKDGGKWRYVNQRAHDEFIAYITPAVNRFCGIEFSEGANPDWLPHPIATATHIINGMGSIVKKCFAELQMMPKLSEIWKNMNEHGMIKEDV